MAHVIVLDSINDDIFVCGACKNVFNSLTIFLEHKKSNCNASEQVTVPKNIEPTLCDASESTKCDASDCLVIPPNINSSVVNQDKFLDDLTCSVCKKKYKKMKSLLAHIKTHNEKPYQCPICGRCFIQNSHLQRHITCHKVWPDRCHDTTAKSVDIELLSYSCGYCDSILSNYHQYKLHLKKHVSLKQYKCIQPGCIDFFGTVEHLISHVLLAHSSAEYHCHICNATFNTLEDIALHQQNHNDQSECAKSREYKCPQCDASFKKFDKLSLHLLMDNHKKVCIHCNKTFASDKRLRLHLQIHSQLKPFECNICNRRFHMKKYLSSHMLKHGSSQFKCVVCKSLFKRPDLLQRHMSLHQATKMHKCPFRETFDCMKEFSRSDKLKLHIRCHTKLLTMKSKAKVRLNSNSRKK